MGIVGFVPRAIRSTKPTTVVATGIDAEASSEVKPLPAKVFTFPTIRDEAEEAEPEMTAEIEETVAEMIPLAKDEPETVEATEPEIEEIAAETDTAEIAAEDSTPTIEEPAEEIPAPRIFDDTVAPPSERTPTRVAPTFTVRAAGETPTRMSGDAQTTPIATEDTDEDELLLDAGNIVSSTDEPVEETPAATSKWIAEEEAETATPADKPARSGGTLFERMSNIARGAAKVDGDKKKAASGGDRDSLDIPRFLNRQNNQ